MVADRLNVLNAGATIPISISLGGQNRFQAGLNVQPYAIASNGPTALRGYNGTAHATQLAALKDLLAQAYPDPLTRTYNATFNDAMDYYNAMTTALAGSAPLQTTFPANNPLASALQMIARVIASRTALSAKRQIFFVSLGGFDTHDNMLEDQPGLFTTLSQALGAFYQATSELGVQDSVTTFTMSEFSRTLNTDGDGTDHAWGGTHFVMGGAVQGGRLYGTPAASGGIFPDLTLNGPDCLQRGQMIPATSCDQYSATFIGTLARRQRLRPGDDLPVPRKFRERRSRVPELTPRCARRRSVGAAARSLLNRRRCAPLRPSWCAGCATRAGRTRWHRAPC